MNVATRIAPTAGQLALAKKLAEGGERRGGGMFFRRGAGQFARAAILCGLVR